MWQTQGVKRLLVGLFAVLQGAAQSWMPQPSGTPAPTTEALRGISAVSSTVAWASGSRGTYLKTTDGGATWRRATVPGAADLDFRDIQAVDDRTVYLLSSGEGPKSRVYKTTDGRQQWTIMVTIPDPKGFCNAVGCVCETHRVLLG